MKGRRPIPKAQGLVSLEQSRDMYGFMVRPQHLESYREYAPIYKEEEAERSERWEQFLNTISDSVLPVAALEVSSSEDSTPSTELRVPLSKDSLQEQVSVGDLQVDREGLQQAAEVVTTRTWGQLRKSLWVVEQAVSIQGRGVRNSASTSEAINSVSKRKAAGDAAYLNGTHNEQIPFSDSRPRPTSGGNCEGSGEDSEEEFCDATESTDMLHEGESMGRFVHNSPKNTILESIQHEGPWEEELRSLVRGGVPMALRGELWQIFVGTKARRVHGHYHALLTLLADGGGDSNGVGGLCDGSTSATANYLISNSGILEKWTNQIEKDLPRTFPGHPALDEDGRNALRRLLTAYARHNPSVGYCQAMNFLAALLLLLMPEENAFWTLTGIIDDYFEGYYSEKMLEAQVDQLVFEELVREHFPRLVNHLDTLGVQVAWVSGPWFLSIFVNVLPWESVLRVWDVLLYEGNRCMLFRTALALMEIYASALLATRDAGDAVSLLQSMASATFDSSHLVLIGCMGFQAVTEAKLKLFRSKHRPDVLAALHERSIELHLWRNSNCSMASKLPYLYSEEGSGGDKLLIKKSITVSDEKGSISDIAEAVKPEIDKPAVENNVGLSMNGHLFFESSVGKAVNIVASNGLRAEDKMDGTDLHDQVVWLKMELCRALEDKKAATLRAVELEAALVEMVKQDNRLFLSAKVERLEEEVSELKQALEDKKQQEEVLLEVLLRLEQEQRVTEDGRCFAEQDAAAQRRAAELIQEKYELEAEALSEMEKRAVMAESMLEAHLSYQALGNSPHSSFRRKSEIPRTSVDGFSVKLPWSNNSSAVLQDSRGDSTSPIKIEAEPGKEYHLIGNGSNSHEQQEEKTSGKQGLFSRPFVRPWVRSVSLEPPPKGKPQPVSGPGILSGFEFRDPTIQIPITNSAKSASMPSLEHS